MAEDGCYIVVLSSMEHRQCPPDPGFVRGETLPWRALLAPSSWVWMGVCAGRSCRFKNLGVAFPTIYNKGDVLAQSSGELFDVGPAEMLTRDVSSLVCCSVVPCDAYTGEAHIVYTISPRRDSVPGGHASQECMLACHVQVSRKIQNLFAGACRTKPDSCVRSFLQPG